MNARLLNYSKFNSRLNASILYGLSSRWIIPVNVTTPTNSRLLPVTILICNTSQEEAQGLYSYWTHRVLGANEAHVSSPFLRALGVAPSLGEQILLSLNLNALLGVMISQPLF